MCASSSSSSLLSQYLSQADDDNDDDDGRIGCDSGGLYSFECVTMKVLMRFHGYSPGKLATKY